MTGRSGPTLETQDARATRPSARRWQAASLVVVAALFAGATEQWAIASAVAALIVVALALGGRVALGPTASRIAIAGAAGAGATLGAAIPAGHGLRPPWPSFALAALFAGIALLCRRERDRGAAVALLPGLAALTACGEAPLGRVYVVVIAAHLAFALLALRASTATPGRPSRAEAIAAAVVVGVGAGMTVAFALALPPLAAWSQGRILSALGLEEVGFSERMALGSLHGLLQSDEVVMRVDGPRVDYLRGAVFDHYELGRWGRRRRPTPAPFVRGAPSRGDADRTRVTVVAGARDRFFVPLGAHAILPEPGGWADGFGVLRARDAALAVSFETTGDPDLPIAAPTAEDLEIPTGMRPELVRIANAWTAGAVTAEDKAQAIARRLRAEFTYSLDFDHQRRSDPLFDFLLDDHRGHCEYFASALTLLARAAGVPARVAIGYRVAEENALGGYWIVRERNAHAWSEVYVEGRGFVTMDATPEGAVAANEPHREGILAAAIDVARSFVTRFGQQITLRRAAALLGVAAAWIAFRRWRRRSTSAGTKAVNARRDVDRTPPGLVRLLAALAAGGSERAPWEPLERFADRLAETLDGSGAQGAVTLLHRWAALRYGGIGAEDAIARDTDAWLASKPALGEPRAGTSRRRG